jgi:predicted dehydrogenase
LLATLREQPFPGATGVFMTMLRIGMIGAGAVATRHADTIAGFPDVRLVAVADEVAERASALAGRYGAAAYDGHDPMLEREELDAVYVCVPPYAHGAPELAVIGAGLPMFVEKPLAADLATAEMLAARVEAAGLVTATGYHWRAMDTTERAAGLLNGHPVRLAVGSWLGRVAPPAWWTSRALSGGQTVEQVTHVLDTLRHLVGEVTQVSALAARVHPATAAADIDQVAVASLRFASGALGTLATTNLLDWHDDIGVRLITEGLAIELTETELVVRDGNGLQRWPDSGEAKASTDRDFLDAVQGGPDRIRVPYAEAMRTHRLTCAVARSAAEGRPVDV